VAVTLCGAMKVLILVMCAQTSLCLSLADILSSKCEAESGRGNVADLTMRARATLFSQSVILDHATAALF
jgi:hypothetical protein